MKNLRRLTIKFYAKHLLRYKWLLVSTTIAAIMASSTAMGFPLIYKMLINTIVSADIKDVAVNSLLWILLVFVGLDIFNTLIWRVLLYSLSVLEVSVMRNILNECFEFIQKHSFNFFNNSFTGALVKRVSRMSYSFEGIADALIFEFIPIAVRTLIANIVLLYLSLYLGVPLLIWTIFFIISSYYITLYKIKHYDLASARADTKVTASLSDAIMNSVNIKLFSTHAFEQKKFERVTNIWHEKKKASWFFGIHVETFQGLIAIFLNFLLIYFAIRLWQKDLITVGDFVLLQFYLTELFMALWHFGRNLQRLYERFADAEEMTEILHTDWEVADAPNAKSIKIIHGRVEFKNIHFAYEDGSGVIKGLSLKVKPGEKVALIGPSGGGKSTVFKLLLRLFDVKKGQILIDGQDISKTTQDSLRKQVALVPQDPILFHRTIIENIRYGRLDASDKEVFVAARLARCHDFIKKFPKGYETHVGERGVKLSGGERQRVAIARAILSNTKILILDEATSSLDSESEKLIQEALANLMKHKTTFIIAHRLSTIVDMDRIIVLDGGRIVEEGTHSELIRQKNSLYEKLWGLQVGGYLE